MTEADIQADYTRKVVAARVGLAKALETRIANLKDERNRALELIREGGRLNAESQSNNEESGQTPQAGDESQGGAERGLGKEEEAEQSEEQGEEQGEEAE